ncbi:MAG: TldD/PmbA family protein [Candidatus Bathyarchaeota archaeon]|nr:MAG: TldD/PmbA family protein [Candidatus Bathyarchaeota archaeon]
MGTKRLLEAAEEAVHIALKCNVDQAQVATFLVDSALTRYANSQIHQNVASKRGGASIKVVVKKQVGTARVNSLEKRQIEDAVKNAVRIAEVTPPNEDFKSLPNPSSWTPIKGTFDRKTAECTPNFRAEIVKETIDKAHSKSSLIKAVAGSFFTGSFAFSVSNSLGVSAYAKMSRTSLQTTVISSSGGSQGFGSAEQHSKWIEDIEPSLVASEAAETSIKSINPIKIPVGEYEVVLSPRAVASIFMFLGYIGFSATSYQDGQSFVKYNLNRQVFDKSLNVKDDSRDAKTLYSLPVDGEGVQKKKVQLVEDGRVSAESICYDSFTAGREKNRRSTGHSIPPIFRFSSRPRPFNILIAPGSSSIEEMVKDTQQGVFVTRFHYTNPVEPSKAILTALTRDGTFFIKNGEITKPVMNLRYTDSMLSTLKEIPMIGKELDIMAEVTAPAMKLQKLRFTGITQY